MYNRNKNEDRLTKSEQLIHQLNMIFVKRMSLNQEEVDLTCSNQQQPMSQKFTSSKKRQLIRKSSIPFDLQKRKFPQQKIDNLRQSTGKTSFKKNLQYNEGTTKKEIEMIGDEQEGEKKIKISLQDLQNNHDSPYLKSKHYLGDEQNQLISENFEEVSSIPEMGKSYRREDTMFMKSRNYKKQLSNKKTAENEQYNGLSQKLIQQESKIQTKSKNNSENNLYKRTQEKEHSEFLYLTGDNIKSIIAKKKGVHLKN